MTKYCKLSKHTIQKITNLLQNTLRCSDRDKKCFILSEKCSCETEVPEPAVKFRCLALAVLSSAKLPFQRWHLVPSARMAQQAAVLGAPVPGRVWLGLLPVSGTAGAQRALPGLWGSLYTTGFPQGCFPSQGFPLPRLRSPHNCWHSHTPRARLCTDLFPKSFSDACAAS